MENIVSVTESGGPILNTCVCVTCLQSGVGLEYNVSSAAASAPRILPSYEMSEGVRDSLGRLVFKDHAGFTPSLTPKQVSARLHPSSPSCLPKKLNHIIKVITSPYTDIVSWQAANLASVNSATAQVNYRNRVRMDMPYLWDWNYTWLSQILSLYLGGAEFEAYR